MIQGSLVPNITIFKEDGTIDVQKTEWHMRWMFDNGVDGLFLTGSYGAGPLMTNEERIEIFKLARKVADNYQDKILIPHVGCIDTKNTIILAKAAEKIGVDAIGAVPPFYYKHSNEIVIQYYKDIVDAVSLPVFAYNNPGTSRFTFSKKVVKELQDYGLKGLKDSPLNVGFLSSVAYEAQNEGKDFQVILGTSTGWLPFYYMGVKATIAGMNNWAPEIITEMVRATVAGEKSKAIKAYTVMMDLSEKMHFTDSTIISHMALYVRGYDAGLPRKPMFMPDFSDKWYPVIKVWMQEAFDALGIPFTLGEKTFI